MWKNISFEIYALLFWSLRIVTTRIISNKTIRWLWVLFDRVEINGFDFIFAYCISLVINIIELSIICILKFYKNLYFIHRLDIQIILLYFPISFSTHYLKICVMNWPTRQKISFQSNINFVINLKHLMKYYKDNLT